MASWISRDHYCDACGHTTIALHDRAAETDLVPCESCGEPARKVISANITQASYVDGNGRLNHLREQRAVEREFKKARRQGRKDDVKRLRKELTKTGLKI